MVFVLFYHRLAPKGESSTSLSECACWRISVRIVPAAARSTPAVVLF